MSHKDDSRSADDPVPVTVEDSWSTSFEGQVVTIAVFQRGGLIAATEHVVGLWEREEDEANRSSLAIAATLTAHAACDAILNETAIQTRFAGFKPKWTNRKLVERLTDLVPTLPPDAEIREKLSRLTYHKNALAHAEPENERSIRIGTWTAGNGTAEALQAVRDLNELLPGRR